jgi:Putative beta-barrel porin 2
VKNNYRLSNNSNRVCGPGLRLAGAAAVLSFGCSGAAFSAVDIYEPRDTLDAAVAGPAFMAGSDANAFTVSLADHQYYDSNVFRFPTGTPVTTFVAPDASRSDTINSPQAGLAGQWGLGRQIFDVSVNVQENHFFDNTYLSNLSTDDHAVWNWGVGGVLTGQVGASYLRDLVSFVNNASFERTIYSQQQYYGSARYQVGPHWVLYGGLMDNVASVSQANSNDSRSKAVDLGAELATDAMSTFGIDYRYTDARYPNSVVLDNVVFDPDWREDRLRFLLKRPVTEKTTIDLSVGYLRRDYANSLIGSFSGPVWRIIGGWQPTEKTQLIVTTWRNLQAYLTDQSNYFRGTGVSLSPTWLPTERITLTLTGSRETQSYIGSSDIANTQPSRHDTLNVAIASIGFAATRSLSFDASFRHEQRSSNGSVSVTPLNGGILTTGGLPVDTTHSLSYVDNYAGIGAKFVF